ncbi:MAG: transketolase [Clostridia bacterium]|nr:transketolase [Clostridia bacterium]
MRDTFVKTLLDIAKKDKNVYIVTGDLGFGVLKPFWDELPEQIINAGIAEQNMTSIAAGLAMQGKVVYTYSIGNFPTLRCIEQIRNDCAYHSANVKVVCVGGGFVYGSLGMSHHATEDLAIMRALPDVTVVAPGDLVEAAEATKAIYTTPGTCYLRLGRGGEKQIHNKIDDFKIGKAIKIKTGKNVAVFSTGAIFDEVDEACHELEKEGITPTVYTFPTVKPIDKDTIIECAKEHKAIITVEEHNLSGGFGSAVAEVLAEADDVKAKLVRVALDDRYSCIVGSQKYLRKQYGIDAQAVIAKVKENY